jgi:2,4-dienoyl-CoA reductase-like NADH-dependent reductase (Old Yellow Enzyme family)
MTGVEPMGPSIMMNEKVPYCRAMTEQEVNRLVTDFTHGAIRAKEAGFDGVQLHGAHGYLISQFLSPFYNKRHDRYGGNIINRARIVVDIVENIQQEIDKDYPVMIKMNSEDFVEGGLTVGEMLEMVAIFENLGITAVELSGGLIRYSGNNGPARKGVLNTEEEVYYLNAASSYKRCCTVPLMLVGGIRSYNVAEQLILEGITDYVSFSRPLIREPHLIKQWKAGDTVKASCISCNSCLNVARQQGKLYCVVQARQSS